MIPSRARKAAPLAALLVLPFFSTPAHADVPIGGGAASANDCSGLHCWYAILTANVQPIGNTGLALVSWNCQATATVDAASTSVTRCTVGTQSAPPITLPGAYTATAGASVFVIGSHLTACVAGQSAFVEAMLGDQVVGSDGCSTLVIARIDI